MDILIDTYYTLLPIIATSIMGYLVWYLQNQKKSNDKRLDEEQLKREANADGTRAILLYMLERLYEEYKLQNCVTHEQRQRFKDIYMAYHNLGGNGYGTQLWEFVKELEINNNASSISPYFKLLQDANERSGKKCQLEIIQEDINVKLM